MYEFLLELDWRVACSAGSALVILLVFLGARSDAKTMRTLAQTLRCPECGGEYEGASVLWAPRVMTLRNPAPGVRLPPIDPPPPELQATCAACGLIANFTKAGQLQRTCRIAPSAT